ncbi:hypothetical protein AXE80_10140 [Wenyingzhuangia fucanilytica]|uniref:Uncharacterized protein n=1 Tax=Wenyingzhuangia fucanilytica TaxID=1790137 RepID=A0A1B1Y772_9FLAO|nr:sulfatase-like hydrolase/transferase [Wenyingzhuangia fucanilytica]ANW96613.1 hypothetical protein AXE80_10140 [Wenyingzhuangia fucanilytica]
MKKRHFKTYAIAFLTFIAIINSHAQTQGTRPNIIVILADDLGYGDVGFNRDGNFPSELGVIPTPNIDKLANSGVVLKNAHVAHPFCGPSRAALLTGMMPHRIGAQYNLPNDITTELGIPVNETYFPKLLQDTGYNTAAFGKWHLGFKENFYQPLDRGFDYFFGFLGGGKGYFENGYEDNYYHRLGGSNPVTNEYQDPLWRQRGYVDREEFSNAADEDYLTDVLTDEAITYIQNNASSSDPFFMYLAYNAPHTPLEAPADEIAQFKLDNPDFEDLVRNSDYIKNSTPITKLPENERDAKIEEFVEARITYATMVANMDENIGRLIDELDNDMDVYNNTLIIFLSDNGGYTFSKGAVNYPLDALKGSVKEGGHKVPMFVHWPAKITSPAIYNHQISSLDIYPTLVSLAGGTVPEEKIIDGIDFMDDLIAGNDARPSEPLLIIRPQLGFENGGISMGQWKITKTGSNGSWNLYNIITDPGESTNLSNSEPNADDIIQEIVDKSIDIVVDFKDVKPAWFDNDGDGSGHPHSSLWDDGTLPAYDKLFDSQLLLLDEEINLISIEATTNAVEGETNGVFTVSLPDGITANQDITVSYATSGEAVNGVDYTSLSGTVVIPNGENSSEIVVNALLDGENEVSETLTITLTGTDVGNVSDTPKSINIFDPVDPTSLTAGDVVIVGYKAEVNTAELAFMILKDIKAGTSLSISNRGWKSDGSFNIGGNGSPYSIDDVFSWTASEDHSSGTIFKLESNGSVTTVINGVETVVGSTVQTFGSDGDWDLSLAGDSVLIYSGNTSDHPTTDSDLWITALNNNGISNSAGWAVGGGNAYCELPNALIGFDIDVTGGDASLNLWDLDYGVYTGAVTGNADVIRASINDYQNWTLNDSNAYYLWSSNTTVGANQGDIVLGELNLSSKSPKLNFKANVYPNPTSDYFNVNVDKSVNKVEVELLSVMGALIVKVQGTSNHIPRIDASSLPAGMYLLRIKGDNNLIIEKVIKI